MPSVSLSIFTDSRILPFGLQTSYAIALADLDGDGDLDAFVGNTSYYDDPANTVWFNDGAGNFTDSGQRLGSVFTWDVALGDLDDDGDLDVYAANSELNSAVPDEIWLNDGAGYFTDSGQRLGNTLSRAVALGDLDGDGDLDAFVANGITERSRPEPDTVWLNNGQGVFTSSGQSLGGSPGLDVALGDLDRDGDLDAFVANGDPQRVRSEPNKVWLNNGSAVFSDSGQNLGNALSQAVALGDLDGDSDLDAFIANGGGAILDGQPDEVWLNNGSGIFHSNGQSLGTQSSYGASLGDLHQDGTLDIFVAGYYGGNRVWLNDGNGHLTFSSPGFGTENAADVALGDVDGDGDIDALAANAISKPNRLWLNRGSGGPALEQLAPPSGLAANVLSPTSIDLGWIDHALGETSYQVERSLDGTTGWTEIAVLSANSVSYLDTAVSCSQMYTYRVRAHRENDDLYSAYSHLASARDRFLLAARSQQPLRNSRVCQPDRPSHGWTTPAKRASIGWSATPDGSTAWAQIAVLPVSTTTYSDSSLTCGTHYSYRVRAYRTSDGVYSAYSNTAEATTNPCAVPAPSNLSAVSILQTQIDLSWIDNASDESAYQVERQLYGETNWVEMANLSANSTMLFGYDLSCGTYYSYRVRAYRASDGAYSAYSNTADAVTAACPYKIFLPGIFTNQ